MPGIFSAADMLRLILRQSVALVLASIAAGIIGSYIPARRATKVESMVALRND